MAGGAAAVTMLPTVLGATPTFDRNDVREDGGWSIAYHFSAPDGSEMYVASTMDEVDGRWLKCDATGPSAEVYAAGRALCEGLHPHS